MTRARPGDGLLHPIALLAIAMLVVNDHVLKRAVPGVVTGKLSDVAGMIFFPLFLQALYEVAAARGSFAPSRGVLLISIAATALVFAATKTLPFANELYRNGLALLQWPVRSLFAWRAVALRPVALVRDVTDLSAVPACAVAVVVHATRTAAARAA
jgi:hypothetical protein